LNDVDALVTAGRMIASSWARRKLGAAGGRLEEVVVKGEVGKLRLRSINNSEHR
jgi:hypothetical protein